MSSLTEGGILCIAAKLIKLREIEGDKTTSIYQTVARFNEYLSFGVGRQLDMHGRRSRYMTFT
jgi:hypothetical protein